MPSASELLAQPSALLAQTLAFAGNVPSDVPLLVSHCLVPPTEIRSRVFSTATVWLPPPFALAGGVTAGVKPGRSRLLTR